MNSMPDRIVHIGFPKTATTYLQWEVFPYLMGIKYVDYNACRDVFPQIISTDILDHDLETLRRKMEKYEEADKINLYSFESLAGSPYSLKGMNRSLIAETLKKVGFNKVIITVRSQHNSIDSYYRQYIVHGGTLRFKKWLDIHDKRPWMHKHFSLSYLKYDLLVEHYQNLFGKENVYVINSNDFKSDNELSVKKLCDFIGSEGLSKITKENNKVNSSLTNLSTSILRVCNYFTYNTIRPSQFFHDAISTRNFWLVIKLFLDPYLLRFFSSSKSYLEKYDLKTEVESFYLESNIKLVKICGVLLK
jgi:hypothetical protein